MRVLSPFRGWCIVIVVDPWLAPGVYSGCRSAAGDWIEMQQMKAWFPAGVVRETAKRLIWGEGSAGAELAFGSA
jgi:hypothetical protein